jgi:hypothetical protein
MWHELLVDHWEMENFVTLGDMIVVVLRPGCLGWQDDDHGGSIWGLKSVSSHAVDYLFQSTISQPSRGAYGLAC